MSKVINKVSFEIEHYNGDTYMGFEVYINDNGTIGVSKTYNCCVADIDIDYIFDTDNSLYRIQADEPISEDKLKKFGTITINIKEMIVNV